MLKSLFFFLLIVLISPLNAQLEDGTLAPDFTGLDLDGNTINLYDILAEGQAVILDIGATWCFPCWEYHQTKALDEFTDTYGAQGTNEARVLFIEGDVKTSLEDLQGTGPSTLGDWIADTNYPIMQLGGIPALYESFGLPFTYLVCPDRTLKLIGEIPAEFLAEEVAGCAPIEIAPEPDFSTILSTGCGGLEVSFVESSWPRPEVYLWDFGDGMTSTERAPTHRYSTPGFYDVTLTVSNAFGQNQLTKSAIVQIGEGHPSSNQSTGKLDTLGSGRMFDRGIQGLLFDAHQDFILSSATVYSDRDEWRSFVVTDTNEIIIARRDMWIPEGEQRLQLDLVIPQGENYRIGMLSDAWLYRNDGGTDYPYGIDGLVTINSSTVVSDPEGFYYYLYNWRVRDFVCNDFASSIEETDADEAVIILSPNPVESTLTVRSSHPQLHTALLLDAQGRQLQVGRNYVTGQLSLDVESLQSGVYFIKLGTDTQRFIKL